MTARKILAVTGVALLLVSPPLLLASHAAFYAVWYAGVALLGVYLTLDIAASRRDGPS